MTKAELVTEVAIQTGYDRATILNVLETSMSVVKKSVAGGENVYLRGFGSFITKIRAQKIARNITAKMSIVVPEHKVPAFKPSDDFCDLLK